MAVRRLTALHAWHLAHGARMVDFAGWEMPIQYRGIIEEHRAVRTSAGLFDVSHMGEIVVQGTGAMAWLNRIVPNDVSRLAPGRALYTPLCHPHGGTIDDLLIYCLGEDDFLLCVNASNADRDFGWLLAQRGTFAGRIENVSDQWSLLALQGPAAAALFQPHCAQSLEGWPAFSVARTQVAGIHALVARTGYTGEDGFEIFCPWADGPHLAAVLAAAGAVPCGLGARDSLRTEAGYPLYGHELDDTLSPLAAGLGWTVKLGKPGGFIGRDALAAEKAAGSARRIVWFRTRDRRIVRPGTPVRVDAATVGTVTSGTLSPGLQESIGSACLEAKAVGSVLTVDIRGSTLTLEPVQPPFHTSRTSP